MDKFVAKARAKIAQHQREILRLNKMIDDYNEIFGEPAPKAKDESAKPNRPPASPMLAPTGPTGPTHVPSMPGLGGPASPLVIYGYTRGSAIEDTVKDVRSLVEAAGRPMRLSEVFSALEAKGVTFPGKNPINTLGARLSNSKELISLHGFGWWLADRPYEPARYAPTTKTPGA